MSRREPRAAAAEVRRYFANTPMHIAPCLSHRDFGLVLFIHIAIASRMAHINLGAILIHHSSDEHDLCWVWAMLLCYIRPHSPLLRRYYVVSRVHQ